MATDLQTDREPSVAALVGGIVGDVQNLIGQQFTLLRREIEQELRQAKRATISLSAGTAIAAFGGVLLLVMLVHALHAGTALPLWGCYGIVGGGVTAIGAGLLIYGRREAADVHLVKPPETAEAMKENLQWLSNPTTSDKR